LTSGLRHIPEGQNLHQKVITFGVVIWFRDAPVNFLGGLRSREPEPAVNGTKVVLSDKIKRVAKIRTVSR
jgi:hypothetical protein